MPIPSDFDRENSGSPTVVVTAPPPSIGGRDDEPWLQALSLAARLVLGSVMLIAGAEKLTALEQFAHAIANYQLLPISTVNIAAILFVWTEITVGILLLAGAAVRGSALVSGALLLIFIIAVLTAMARGLEIDCGCFVSKADLAAGTKPAAIDTVGWPKVFVNLATLAGAIFLIYFPKSYLTIDRVLRGEGVRGRSLKGEV
jgi:uncharacterized membrane protein YphA (DoxX/SURF4 family)